MRKPNGCHCRGGGEFTSPPIPKMSRDAANWLRELFEGYCGCGTAGESVDVGIVAKRETVCYLSSIIEAIRLEWEHGREMTAEKKLSQVSLEMFAPTRER